MQNPKTSNDNGNFLLPKTVALALSLLTAKGFQAFVVGGAVRDHVAMQAPHDYDLTTSATPEEMLDVFSAYSCILTGLKHGTITVLIDKTPLEITTFRTDGSYTDSRHPDAVSFTKTLVDDLARRDFTINAMAYNPETGLVDRFGGVADLEAKTLRTVGDPALRFTEDALRILRALRFASVLDFSIEEATHAAIFKLADRLSLVASERIREELSKLLLGVGAVRVLRTYFPVFCVFLPELSPLKGFLQHSPYHAYDVWEHTLSALSATPNDLVLRLAILLHDIGKPSSFTRDKNGVGHFYGHENHSGCLAEHALKRLKFDKKTTDFVVTLIKHHMRPLPITEKEMRRSLAKLGEPVFSAFLSIVRADRLGQKPIGENTLSVEQVAVCEKLFYQVRQEENCLSLKTLAISGDDLKEIGIPPGKKMGVILKKLLALVIDGDLKNDKDVLLSYAKERF